jgi:hypothetical protein
MNFGNVKNRIKLMFDTLNYLAGVSESPPKESFPPLTSRLWSVWWFLLLVVIMFCSGQSSEFIYIDF